MNTIKQMNVNEYSNQMNINKGDMEIMTKQELQQELEMLKAELEEAKKTNELYLKKYNEVMRDNKTLKINYDKLSSLNRQLLENNLNISSEISRQAEQTNKTLDSLENVLLRQAEKNDRLQEESKKLHIMLINKDREIEELENKYNVLEKSKRQGGKEPIADDVKQQIYDTYIRSRLSMQKIAEQYGVSVGTVHKVIKVLTKNIKD